VRRLAAALAILTGCAPVADFYPPPARQYRHGFAPGSGKCWVAMNDPLAPIHLIRGVSGLENDRHRWAAGTAELEFLLPVTSGLKFQADWSVSAETFPKTGPVTIVVRVNGVELDRVRYDSAGERRYEKPVDSRWLRAGGNTVTLETSPVDQSRVEGGRALVLVTAGFVE
jgi:hypothetical protein